MPMAEKHNGPLNDMTQDSRKNRNNASFTIYNSSIEKGQSTSQQLPNSCSRWKEHLLLCYCHCRAIDDKSRARLSNLALMPACNKGHCLTLLLIEPILQAEQSNERRQQPVDTRRTQQIHTASDFFQNVKSWPFMEHNLSVQYFCFMIW